MKITNIYLKKLEARGRLKAAGSITFDDEFIVKNVFVVEGNKGLFISMPSKKDEDGKYRNVAFPISRELRDMITEEVLSIYKGMMEKAPEEKEEDANE